jgi:O-methyltransferase involved in polyketide biosynthesis
MSATNSVRLGEVQETLLSTLYARAVETRKKHGILRDPKAVEMVEAIDYDFAKFDGAPMLFGSVLRTLLLDHWARDFLTRYPAGTIVEIGAGLNTRFERVDNGRVHWVDLDLPDSMNLRRGFFDESDRRSMVAVSILDDDWVAAVKANPGPYLFVAEGVLLYLQEENAEKALGLVTDNFPGAFIAFDTAGRWLVDHQDDPGLKKNLSASFAWACDDPRELERPGLRLLESRTLLQQPGKVPLPFRLTLPALRLLLRKHAGGYRVNLFSSRS